MTDPTMTGTLLRLVPLGFEEAEGSIGEDAFADPGPAIARTLLLVAIVLPESSTAMTLKDPSLGNTT